MSGLRTAALLLFETDSLTSRSRSLVPRSLTPFHRCGSPRMGHRHIDQCTVCFKANSLFRVSSFEPLATTHVLSDNVISFSFIPRPCSSSCFLLSRMLSARFPPVGHLLQVMSFLSFLALTGLRLRRRPRRRPRPSRRPPAVPPLRLPLLPRPPPPLRPPRWALHKIT